MWGPSFKLINLNIGNEEITTMFCPLNFPSKNVIGILQKRQTQHLIINTLLYGNSYIF